MSPRKDTDYLSISARIRGMENRLLTRERMDRIIDARDDAEARKVLAECGYPVQSGVSLEQALTAVREQTMKELSAAVPDVRILEIFALKYDYHNAKTLVKAGAVKADPSRLLLGGGRYAPELLLEGWKREDLPRCSENYRKAVSQAQALLADTRDPQQADLLLDKACYAEMGQLARELGSAYLEGYVRLLVDAANLRTYVRVQRMGREAEFLRRCLMPGGNVSEQTIAAARPEALPEVFSAGSLAEAAQLGAGLTKPGSGALTAFEKACDDAVTAYVSIARRVPFGEQVVIGYLYAKEAELTAVRTMFAGRAAGLDGDTIRRRLRETYC